MAEPTASEVQDLTASLAETRARRDGNPGMAWNYQQDAAEDIAALLDSPAFARLANRYRFGAWNEAVQAVAWATEHGPDPLRYVADHNPYATAPQPAEDSAHG